MHAYRRYITDKLRGRTWTMADSVRGSGLSDQTISKTPADMPPTMRRLPGTIVGLAKGFSDPESNLLSITGEAMGVSADVDRAQLAEALPAELPHEVVKRPEMKAGESGAPSAYPMAHGQPAPASVARARRAQAGAIRRSVVGAR